MRGGVFLFIFLFFGFSSSAQEDIRNIRIVTFNEFLEEVYEGNLRFLIERFEVSVAEASVAAAKAFQDPELEMVFPRFKEDEFSAFPKNTEFQLYVPIELFGKRKYRIQEARAEELAAGANLEVFLVRLKAEAAKVFVDVLKHQRLLENTEEAFLRLQNFRNKRVPPADKAEDRLEIVQTQMEVRFLRANLLEVKERLTESKYQTYRLMGSIPEDSIVFSGNLALLPVKADLEMLLKGVANRPDITSSRFTVDAAEYSVKKAKAERLPDIQLIAGYFNEEAITPLPSNAFFGGLVLPIKISGLNKGEYRKRVSQLEQANIAAKEVLLKAEMEVREKWEKLDLLEKKAALYGVELVSEAEEARDLTMVLYGRKEMSLLRALEADRNLQQIFGRYYDILSEYKKALIDLSTASGTWLVEF